MKGYLKLGLALLSIMTLTTYAPAYATDDLEEQLSESFTLSADRIQCQQFSKHAVFEIEWPKVDDSGVGVELARVLLQHLRGNELFYNPDGKQDDCLQLKGWLAAHPEKEFDGQLMVKRRHQVRPNCPISRDEGDVCTYTLEEVGSYQLVIGTKGSAPQHQLNSFVVTKDQIIWSQPFRRDLTTPTETKFEVPYSEIKPKLADELAIILKELADSIQLDKTKWKVGAIGAAHTSGKVGDLVTIEEIFGNGWAIVDFHRVVAGRAIGPLVRIGIPVEEISGFKPGDRIRHYDSGVRKYHYATTQQTFSNKFLEVKYDRGGESMVVKSSQFEKVD